MAAKHGSPMRSKRTAAAFPEVASQHACDICNASSSTCTSGGMLHRCLENHWQEAHGAEADAPLPAKRMRAMSLKARLAAAAEVQACARPARATSHFSGI